MKGHGILAPAQSLRPSDLRSGVSVLDIHADLRSGRIYPTLMCYSSKGLAVPWPGPPGRQHKFNAELHIIISDRWFRKKADYWSCRSR
jgi:hypothetical protein